MADLNLQHRETGGGGLSELDFKTPPKEGRNATNPSPRQQKDVTCFNTSLCVVCQRGARSVKGRRADGALPNGCLIAAHNGRCRLSGSPPVTFTMIQASPTGSHSFVHQFRGLKSHRGSHKRVINIFTPCSVCWRKH